MQTAAAIPLRHVSSSSSPFSSSSNIQNTLTLFSSLPSTNEYVSNPKKVSSSQKSYSLELRQKLKEFQKNLKMPASSVASTARSSEFQDKLKYLDESCDQLIKFLDSGKVIKIIDDDKHESKSDRIYDRHICNLHNGYIEFQTENGKLKHRLAEIDTKICEILNENDFLRWENEQYKIEMDGLRNQLDKENLLTKELKAEICCLKLNQDQINHVHSVRMKDELSTAWDIAKTTEDSLKRKLEDFEREAKLKEMEYCRKIESLEDEVNDKKELVKRYEQKVEDLTEENYRATQLFGNTKKELEEELERLYQKEANLETKLTASLTKLSTFDYYNHSESPDSVIQANHPDIDSDDPETIEHLQNRIKEILLNNNNNSNKDSNELQNLINEKTLQIFDLRERIIFLEEECRAVKDENVNSNILIKQMTKDMKFLLDVVKENKV